MNQDYSDVVWLTSIIANSDINLNDPICYRIKNSNYLPIKPSNLISTYTTLSKKERNRLRNKYYSHLKLAKDNEELKKILESLYIEMCINLVKGGLNSAKKEE